MNKTIVKVCSDPINIQDAVTYVSDPAHGAIDTFIGTVRNHHEGKSVTGITYDVHEVLAKKVLKEICEEATGLWANTNYYVAHYKGVLKIGDISIVIAVSSAHRGESFDACRYVIEEIKKRAPVWKKEHYQDGKSDWLPGHSLTSEAEESLLCCGHCQKEEQGHV